MRRWRRLGPGSASPGPAPRDRRPACQPPRRRRRSRPARWTSATWPARPLREPVRRGPRRASAARREAARVLRARGDRLDGPADAAAIAGSGARGSMRGRYEASDEESDEGRWNDIGGLFPDEWHGRLVRHHTSPGARAAIRSAPARCLVTRVGPRGTRLHTGRHRATTARRHAERQTETVRGTRPGSLRISLRAAPHPVRVSLGPGPGTNSHLCYGRAMPDRLPPIPEMRELL